MRNTLALIFLSACSFFVATESQAQSFRYANDALRYSRSYPGGTARIVGIGGAQGAIGGDLSSAHANPAGLGFYNRSEISVSPVFRNINNESTYLNESLYDYSSNFGIGHFGLALNRTKNDVTEGWRGGTFAITYNRMQSLHNKFAFEGLNGLSSYTDALPLGRTASSYDDLYYPGDALLIAAIDASLLEIFEDADNPGTFFYDTYFPSPIEDYPVLQKGVVNTEGRTSQLSLSYGGNFDDKLYVGASIGLASIRRRTTITYREVVDPQLYADFPDYEVDYDNNAFTFTTLATDEGSGVNATLGIIGRPISQVSLGLSYRTPTLYSITNVEDYTVATEFRDGERYEGTGQNVFEYTLKTPGSITLSGAAFLNKWGFISTDVEFINYGNSRLTDVSSSLRDDNEAIKDDFVSAVNFRIGGELRYDILRLRAGFGYQGNPYRRNLNLELDGSTKTYSAGAGLKFRNYFIDFALSQHLGNSYFSPYAVEGDVPTVFNDSKATTAVLTLGLSF